MEIAPGNGINLASDGTLVYNMSEMICSQEDEYMNYDVIIIGAGPGGIFAAYELMQK